MRFRALVACGVIAVIGAGHLWFAGSVRADGGLATGGGALPAIPEAASPALGDAPAAPGHLALVETDPVAATTEALPEQAQALIAEVSTPADDARETIGEMSTGVLTTVNETVDELAETIPVLEPLRDIAQPVIDAATETVGGVAQPNLPGLPGSPVPTVAETPAAGADGSPLVTIVTGVATAPGEAVTISIPGTHAEPAEVARSPLGASQSDYGAAIAGGAAGAPSVAGLPAGMTRGGTGGGSGSRLPLPEPPSAGACMAVLAILGAGALLARPRSERHARPHSWACMPTAPPG